MGSSRCSPVSMFPSPMFPSIYVPSLYVPRLYVPRSLCSPVLCFPVPMFPNPYVPQYLCFPIPMLPGTYLPRVFFFGGGGGREVWGVLEQFVDIIGRLAFFFKMVATATLEDLFCSLFERKRCVFNITFPMTSRTRTLFQTPSFLSPAWRSWGGGRLTSVRSSWCSAVCLSVAHTSHRGCRCAFWNFNYLNGRPSAIISFNVPDIWPHFVLFLEQISVTHRWIHFILHTHIP